MRNIFLEISFTKCSGGATLRPFYKKSNLSICLRSTAENVIKFVFIVCTSQRVPKLIKT